MDTDVLIDVLADRQPFADASALVWGLAERGEIDGLISVLSLSNICYIVRKISGPSRARQSLILLRDTFSLVACTDQIIHQAIDADWPDFEDAIQYCSAVHARADVLVTRNIGHFKRVDVPVMAPSVFLERNERGAPRSS